MSFTVKLNPKNDPATKYIVKLEGIKRPYGCKDMYEVTEALVHYFTEHHKLARERCPICLRGDSI